MNSQKLLLSCASDPCQTLLTASDYPYLAWWCPRRRHAAWDHMGQMTRQPECWGMGQDCAKLAPWLAHQEAHWGTKKRSVQTSPDYSDACAILLAKDATMDLQCQSQITVLVIQCRMPSLETTPPTQSVVHLASSNKLLLYHQVHSYTPIDGITCTESLSFHITWISHSNAGIINPIHQRLRV